MEEVWKPIVGYEGYYEVSNLGRVRSIAIYVNSKNNSKRYRSERVLKGILHNGYVWVTLSKNNVKTKKRVHRLVAEAFIPNPENLPYINHMDEVKTNNVFTNLEWCTVQYNNTYGTARSRAEETKIRLGYRRP